MRIGTFLCWLFGHKFIGEKCRKDETGEIWITTFPTDYCSRCGIRRERND